MEFVIDVVNIDGQNVFRHVNEQGEEVLFTRLSPSSYIHNGTLDIFRGDRKIARSRIVSDAYIHIEMEKDLFLMTQTFRGLKHIFKDSHVRDSHTQIGVSKLDAQYLHENDRLKLETDDIRDLADIIKRSFIIKAACNEQWGNKLPAPRELPRILAL